MTVEPGPIGHPQGNEAAQDRRRAQRVGTPMPPGFREAVRRAREAEATQAPRLDSSPDPELTEDTP